MQRRNSLDVTACILTVADGGTRKTRIQYQCNLSHKQTQTYLQQLLRQKLLVNNSPYFETTPKGHKLLKVIKEIKELLR